MASGNSRVRKKARNEGGKWRGHTYTDADGKDWITDQETERTYGLPRELLAIWSGLTIPRPDTVADRALRRRVLLAYYCKGAGLPMARKERGRFVRRWVKDFSEALHTDPNEASKRQVDRFQTMSAFLELMEPEEGAPPDRFSPEFALAVAVEGFLAGRPSPRDVAAEYRRYHERGKELKPVEGGGWCPWLPPELESP